MQRQQWPVAALHQPNNNNIADRSTLGHCLDLTLGGGPSSRVMQWSFIGSSVIAAAIAVHVLFALLVARPFSCALWRVCVWCSTASILHSSAPPLDWHTAIVRLHLSHFCASVPLSHWARPSLTCTLYFHLCLLSFFSFLLAHFSLLANSFPNSQLSYHTVRSHSHFIAMWPSSSSADLLLCLVVQSKFSAVVNWVCSLDSLLTESLTRTYTHTYTQCESVGHTQWDRQAVLIETDTIWRETNVGQCCSQCVTSARTFRRTSFCQPRHSHWHARLFPCVSMYVDLLLARLHLCCCHLPTLTYLTGFIKHEAKRTFAIKAHFSQFRELSPVLNFFPRTNCVNGKFLSKFVLSRSAVRRRLCF